MPNTDSFSSFPFFSYRDGYLFVEDIALAELAKQYGTPVFIYSKAAILEAFYAYQKALVNHQAIICYALKASSNLAIIQLLAKAGCGADIVSGGELERALLAGITPEKIIFSGVGKTVKEMQRALALGIACFNVESEAELLKLNEVAIQMNTQAAVSLRINPDVDAKSHPYISTGLRQNKFGIPYHQAINTYKKAITLPGIQVTGIDYHIGSQITELTPYKDATKKLLDLVVQLENIGIPIQHLDFGGGLGIRYKDEEPPTPQNVLQEILLLVNNYGFQDKKIYLEPGRSLVGNAGVCLTEVLYLKTGEEKSFCVVDLAMNDILRPSIYQAYHHITPVIHTQKKKGNTYDVVGPICETGDWIGRERLLNIKQGDILSVFSTGAYCMTMSSNYNTRPRVSEVLVDGNASHLIRPRETIEEIFAKEKLL
jgi:diaminopimelate decarboxylase